MRKFFVIILMITFLLASCSNKDAEVAVKKLESHNSLLKEQIESLEDENKLLNNQNKDLIAKNKNLNEEIKKRDSKLDRLMKQIETFEKGQSFTSNIKKTKVLDADLNNDGEREIIKLECSDSKYYRLCTNDLSITSIGVNVDYDFKVVDIDINDNVKEIAISEWGPNKDPKTKFYIYSTDNIFYIGKIKGHINNITFNGDGSLTTPAKGKILCSWNYADKYKLSSRHMIVREPKETYEINHKVKVLKSIPLLKSSTENEMIAALTVGEEVTLLSSDNKKWCQVEKTNGVKGWFEVENFDKIKGTEYTAKDVFEGLHTDNEEVNE